MTKKVYVVDYGDFRRGEAITPPLRADETGFLVYSEEPPSDPFISKQEAESICQMYRGLNPHHPDNTHYCDLAVEQLVDGRYAIVCASHPVRKSGVGE